MREQFYGVLAKDASRIFSEPLARLGKVFEGVLIFCQPLESTARRPPMRVTCCHRVSGCFYALDVRLGFVTLQLRLKGPDVDRFLCPRCAPCQGRREDCRVSMP